MRQNPKQLANGKWQADWRSFDGVRVRKQFRTKKAADLALRQALDARDRGESGSPDRDIVPAPTLREFVDQTAEAVIRDKVLEVTWQGYQRNLRNHILPSLGHIGMDALDTPTIQTWMLGMQAKGCGAATVHRSFSTLSAVMRVGAGLGLCSIPTKRGLSLPTERVARFYVPTIEDVERLSQAVDPRFSALITLCGYCGLRQGEAFGLHPDDVHESTVHVWQVWDRTGRRRPSTKTGHDRTVTLPTTVADQLDEHMRVQPCLDWVFHKGGRPLDPSWFHHEIWDPARKKAGLPDLRFHDLRHGAATISAQVFGMNREEVKAQLGHASDQASARYSHLWQRDPKVLQDRMDEFLVGNIRTPGEPRIGFEPITTRLQISPSVYDGDLLGALLSELSPHE